MDPKAIPGQSLSETNIKRARRASISHFAPVKTAAANAERVTDILSQARQLLFDASKRRNSDSLDSSSGLTLSGISSNVDEIRSKSKLPLQWDEFTAKVRQSSHSGESDPAMKNAELQACAQNHGKLPYLSGRRKSYSYVGPVSVTGVCTDTTPPPFHRLSTDLEQDLTIRYTGLSSETVPTKPTREQDHIPLLPRNSLTPIESTGMGKRGRRMSMPLIMDQQSVNLHQISLGRNVHLPSVTVSPPEEEQNAPAIKDSISENPVSKQTDIHVKPIDAGHPLSQKEVTNLSIEAKRVKNGSEYQSGREKEFGRRKSDSALEPVNKSGPRRYGGRLTGERLKARNDHTLKLQKLLKEIEGEMTTSARLKLQELREEQSLSKYY